MTGAITWGPRAVNSVGVDDGSILRSVEERAIELRERWMKWMRRWMRSELVIIVQAAWKEGRVDEEVDDKVDEERERFTIRRWYKS